MHLCVYTLGRMVVAFFSYRKREGELGWLLKMLSCGTGKMAWQLRALVALPKSSIPSNHRVAHKSL